MQTSAVNGELRHDSLDDTAVSASSGRVQQRQTIFLLKHIKNIHKSLNYRTESSRRRSTALPPAASTERTED
jgi:hypothetical protein